MTLYNDADFDELILGHLVRSPEVFKKAKALRMEADDFLTSFVAGIQTYKVIGELVLGLNMDRPIPKSILELEIRQKVTAGAFQEIEEESLQELIDSFYAIEIRHSYICEHLFDFIKHRRLSKIQQSTTTTTEMYEKMKESAQHFENINALDTVADFAPFDRPIFVEEIDYRDTGFRGLSEAMGGFQPEECSLIMAGSGVGKTACAVNIAEAVSKTVNVGYLSLEEPPAHLIQRFYAKKFELSYSKLRYGNPQEKELLASKFADLEKPDRAALRRLKIIDARHMFPINVDTIKGLLEKYAAEGFIIDTLIIDQMDYLTPAKVLPKGSDKWREYEQISFECDELSMYRIQGEHPISVVVLHQLRGAPKWDYTVDDIAGFKGIVKPFDTAIAIGKSDQDANYIRLQSIKIRHSAPFSMSYLADFEHMSFTDKSWAPKDAKKERFQQKKEAEEKRFNDLDALKNRTRSVPT